MSHALVMFTTKKIALAIQFIASHISDWAAMAYYKYILAVCKFQTSYWYH
jgi:hypothetical protein